MIYFNNKISSFFKAFMLLAAFQPLFGEESHLKLGREVFATSQVDQLTFKKFEASLYKIAKQMYRAGALEKLPARDDGWFFPLLAMRETRQDILSGYGLDLNTHHRHLILNFRQVFYQLFPHVLRRSASSTEEYRKLIRRWQEVADTQLGTLCDKIEKEVRLPFNQAIERGDYNLFQAMTPLFHGGVKGDGIDGIQGSWEQPLQVMGFSPYCLGLLSDLLNDADDRNYSISEMLSPAMIDRAKVQLSLNPDIFEILNSLFHKGHMGALIWKQILIEPKSEKTNPVVKGISNPISRGYPGLSVRIDEPSKGVRWKFDYGLAGHALLPTLRVEEYDLESQRILGRSEFSHASQLVRFLGLFRVTFWSESVVEELLKGVVMDLNEHQGMTYSLLSLFDGKSLADSLLSLKYINLDEMPAPFLQADGQRLVPLNGQGSIDNPLALKLFTQLNPATARALAFSNLNQLILTNLREVKIEVLEELIPWSGTRIALGLNEITVEQAEVLTRFKGVKVFNFPEILVLESFEVMDELAKWKGLAFEFFNIRRVSPAVAIKMRDMEAKYILLPGPMAKDIERIWLKMERSSCLLVSVN